MKQLNGEMQCLEIFEKILYIWMLAVHFYLQLIMHRLILEDTTLSTV